MLRDREIYENLEEFKKKKLCQMRLEKTLQNKTKNLTVPELAMALKDFKSRKSRDPIMYANEIFQPDFCRERSY